MDDIPYEFIDQVFTKMNLHNINVQSPLWMEAALVHKTKRKYFTVDFCVGKSTEALYYYIEGGLAFGDVYRMDDRFIRFAEINVDGAVDEEDAEDDEDLHKIDNLTELVEFISRFNIDRISAMLPHREFLSECVRNGVKAAALTMEFSLEARALLKDHVERGERLHKVILSGEDWPPDVSDDLEDFVCRPEFECLECDYGCLSMDVLKRIVDYWRTQESPWKFAQIFFQTPDGLDLQEELVSWLPICDGDRFGEERGDYCMAVYCNPTYCIFKFYKFLNL